MDGNGGLERNLRTASCKVIYGDCYSERERCGSGQIGKEWGK